MFADAKANIKNEEIKDLMAYLTVFLRNTLKTWNTVQKEGELFISFWLVFHPSWYCPLRTGQGGGGLVGGFA